MQKLSLNASWPNSGHKSYAIVLDVGTTTVKAFVFDATLNLVTKVSRSLTKTFPKKGWVEQDPKKLLSLSRHVVRRAFRQSHLPAKAFFGFGIANQRETVILWDKKTGKPIHPAIVWEDERTKKECHLWQKKFGPLVRQKTGLEIHPYFSASKIRWILTHNAAAQRLLEKNRLAFGTVDTWALWNLADKRPHLTDVTNASRTLLFNIHTLAWDKDLLRIFGIDPRLLPKAESSHAHFGNLKKDVLGFSLPIWAMCGDQQASLYAAGTKTGTTKATFGTGSFLSQIIGSQFALVDDFFTTLTANSVQPTYALEGRIPFYGKNIEEALSSPQKLEQALIKLARLTDQKIKRLPKKPKDMVIDGGVTRDGRLAVLQVKISHLPVRAQKIFDGTALGIAKMLFEKN